MKITFISDFLNHHQIPLCDAWMSNQDVQFAFIATEQVPEERKAMGYNSEFSNYSYCKEIGNGYTMEEAEQLCYDSDVVLIGSASQQYIRRRLKKNKLTFLYSERFFKDGMWTHPGDILRTMKMTTVNRFKSFYVLCASSYTAGDCRRVGFGNKTMKWGYFPQTMQYSSGQIIENKKQGMIKLLWVGRLLKWKHPEVFLSVCNELKKLGYTFTADIIGEGEMKREISDYIQTKGLSENVKMLGSMSPDKVREKMEKSNIFLFTSGYREGWGAVLNEAMNSGCVVVACGEAGATKYLVKHEKNGLLYEDCDDEKRVFELVKKCIDNRELCTELGDKAYDTILHTWNAEVAATRLYEFSKAFLNKKPLPQYLEGPMSQA